MHLRSLKTKILLSVIIVVVVIEGIFLYLNIRSLSRQILDKTEEEAFNLSETIRLSIRNAMIKDRRDEYQRIIDDVAQRKGIVEVRIFNKQGEIPVSSDADKVGTVVDKKAEACYGCHREGEAKVLLPSDSKTRIYHTEKGSLLGLINPIYNESTCYPCHHRATNVLGVLDTTISLEDFEKERTLIYNRMMISGLKRSRDAIEEWTQTLEHRVQERTQELQQVQDQLIRAGKMAAIGELAAGVAHEINNPLTGVLTFSSLMLKKVDENHPWKKDLENIVQQTTRCRNIVRGLLDFARQRKPDKKEWDINTLIDQTLTLVENQARFQNIKIIREFRKDIPMLFLDADQIQQVFMNIIINAADAMTGDGGTLTVKTDLNNGIAEISFMDTGRGISKEHFSKLFTPFFTTKETGKGTGLGLAISYGIIQSHNGDIDVKSEMGKGSTFRIKLPIEKQDGELGRSGEGE